MNTLSVALAQSRHSDCCFTHVPSSSDSIVVFDTRECLRRAAILNDFENMAFGPDFHCKLGQIASWLASGDLFYSSVVTQDGENVRVLSAASILITDTDSRDALLRNEISEPELNPFSSSPHTVTPTLYYSSLILHHPSHAVVLFRGLLREILESLVARDMEPTSAFSIASCNEGASHLRRSGFNTTNQTLYLQRYPILKLRGEDSKTHFWRRLTRSRETILGTGSSISDRDRVGANATSAVYEQVEADSRNY
jgi:hypothetical protein